MAEPVTLTTVPGAVFAAPLIDFLRDNGVEAFSRADDCGGVDPALGFANGTDVLVPDEQLTQAKQLLADWEAAAEK